MQLHTTLNVLRTPFHKHSIYTSHQPFSPSPTLNYCTYLANKCKMTL